MSSGNKPLPGPMMAQIYVVIWRHKATWSVWYMARNRSSYNYGIYIYIYSSVPWLQWRFAWTVIGVITMTSRERNVVPNHRSFHCLFNNVFGSTPKKHQSPHCWPSCMGDSPVNCEFLAQRAINAEKSSIWWRHHMMASMKNYIPQILMQVITYPYVILDKLFL